MKKSSFRLTALGSKWEIDNKQEGTEQESTRLIISLLISFKKTSYSLTQNYRTLL